MENIGRALRQSMRNLRNNPTQAERAISRQRRKVSIPVSEANSSHASHLSSGKQPLTDFIGARATKSTLTKMDKVILTANVATSKQPEASADKISEPDSQGSLHSLYTVPSDTCSNQASAAPNAEQQARLATIYTLSGLTKMKSRIKGMSRIQRYFNKISDSKIERISKLRQQSLQALLLQCTIKQQLHLSTKYSTALAEVAYRFQPGTSKDCHKFFHLCKDFLLIGEGRKTLEDCLPPDVIRTLEQGFPDISKEHFQDVYPSELVKFNESHHMTDATHTAVPDEVAKKHQFQVLQGKETVIFDPSNERHKTLIILAQLNDMYRCVSQSITYRANQMDNLDEATTMLE